MVLRDEARAWLESEFGSDKFDIYWFDNPKYLEHIISCEKFEYAQFFRRGAWSDEGIDLYTEYLRKNNITTNLCGGIDSNKLIRVFLKKGMLDNVMSTSISPSSWTPDLAEEFAKKIGTSQISRDKLENSSFIFKENPIILKGVIEAKRFDLLSAFDVYRNAWTSDNIDLFVSTASEIINSGEEINVFDKLLRREEVYIGFIRNGIYNFADLMDINLAHSVVKNPESYEVMVNSIVDIYKCGKTNSFFEHNLFSTPRIYINFIKNGIYDFVPLFYLMGIDKAYLYQSEENINTLIDAFDKIAESDVKKALYGNAVFDKSNSFLKKILVSDNIDVARGYLWRIDKGSWNNEDIDKFLTTYLNDMSLPKGVASNKYALSRVLDLEDYSKAIHFKNEAWDRNNIYKYCDNSLRDSKISFYIGIDDPYYLYLDNVYFKPANGKKTLTYIPVDSYSFDSDSLKNEDLLYGLGKLVNDGKRDFGNNINMFLEFIHDVNSKNVIYLMRYLMDDNLDNIDKLFDENGMTEYLFEHLIFDNDYREYCKKNGINYLEHCENKVHLQYLSIINRYPELTNKVIIAPENVNDYFDENGIKQGLLEKLFIPGGIDLLLKMDSEIDSPKLSDKKLYVLNKLKEIDNERIMKTFFKYVSKNLDKLDEGNIDNLYKIVKRIEYSNSSEIRSFGELFVEMILERDNPEKELIEIEKIFIQDNIPFVGKIFQVFKKLYPNYKGIGTSDKMSPTLKNMSFEERDRVIFNDLLRIELGSKNRNLQSYLVSMFNSNMLYEHIRDGKKDLSSLSIKDINGLNVYFDRINYLCTSILGMEFNFDDCSNVFDKIRIIESSLSNSDNGFTSIPDYLVKNICIGSGFNSLVDMISYSVYKPQKMNELHQNSVGDKFILEKGDYVKGIRSLKYLPNILQNGSVACEFLGDSSNSDLTPLDTDLSLITKDGSISDALSGTAANSYGPIYFVLKGRNSERFDITRNDENEFVQNDKTKIELFKTGALGSGHYGIRTGFASSEVDFIIASDDFDKIGFEIALNGVYIPVVDKDGKLRFTPEDYKDIRSKMSGLSHYGVYNYKLSDNLVSDDIIKISTELGESEANATFKREAIYESVSSVLDKFGLKLKKDLDDNLTHGTMEFFDTGSTGRGTNVANDSDFDFIVRVDRDLLFDEEKMQSIKSAMLNKFGKDSVGDFRLSDVYLDGVLDPLKIDMTFIVKTNKLDYATESCIKDRLDTIKSIYPDEYDLVVANVVFAKKFFKEAGCYKPKHAGENPQGGLGGVGTETWILQHGGSFYDAACDFVQTAALYPKLEDFQKHYSIQDFGKNHLAEKRGHYPYDNFVYNLSAEGFEKMKIALGQYVSSKNMTNESYGTKK